jgi:hypothetical protein
MPLQGVVPLLSLSKRDFISKTAETAVVGIGHGETVDSRPSGAETKQGAWRMGEGADPSYNNGSGTEVRREQ